MLYDKAVNFILVFTAAVAVQFPNNPTSAMSADERLFLGENKKSEQSNESGHEVEIDAEDNKKFLDDAMKAVLDPATVIVKNIDIVDNFKTQLNEIDKENSTLEIFIDEMDKLSLEVCKASQESLWDFVTDINNDYKKKKMIRVAAEEDEIKKQYWMILKKKYADDQRITNDLKLKRKFRIIKERGTNVQMPQTKQREEIDTMQRIWSRTTVCAFNATVCDNENASRTMSDIISIFKTSNDTNELVYYWKAYRDATGKKIQPIFKDYVARMNDVALAENFTDAGEMWRYAFEDEDFLRTVDRLWREIKPYYDNLHSYVRAKLKNYYKQELKDDSKLIPAHILGNLWAQEWQAIYSKVAPYPEVARPSVDENVNILAKDLFNAVDDFHQSLGFDSSKDTYQDIKESIPTVNCLPSSHDMCDGVNYKIKWCGERVYDITVGLSRAARLLGHIQYFKHYRNLQPLYRDGPNPAFHDAISDIVAVQLTSPKYLQTLSFVKVTTGVESTINHLFWLALEKFPLMAYAYVLDKWRWDIFANSSMEKWNEHWWDLRIKETGISPPVPRNESDLDPAAKYHVVSHVQYITYFISHILEFQILLSLCKKANHTGPLHECSIYGDKEAGKLLSNGMSLGASEDWQTVLYNMTGESELSTKGIIEYFSGLNDFLKEETAKLVRDNEDMDTSAPIIVGIIVVILTLLMFILYCVKKRDASSRLFSLCGLSKNGSLDIAANELSQGKANESAVGVSEAKL
ncbi:angiotensin-converting enzyme-like isoform X1 [Vanessa cardui]|uniref:angiotensin-converting enzyme-like isoform X1 n=1 Tax=Vanessa cardui TaxID=171605 RepID=UPI001F12B3DD|nr:angiotensin-converting enzyme-like isoform X1 [Vanessa cardui]